MKDPVAPEIAALFREYGIEEEPEPANLPAIAEASAAFEHNTMLAIAKIRQILALDPRREDKHYEGILRAQAQVANMQISAQLRVAESKLKAQIAEHDYFHELREALARYKEQEV